MTKIYRDEEVKHLGIGRRVYRKDHLVYKESPELDSYWQQRMRSILARWSLPAFHSFIPNGYITHYLPGTDVHGNDLFVFPAKAGCILSQEQKHQVLAIIDQAHKVGQLLGFTLGDITCGNMILSKDIVYLIDYEVIVPYPLDTSYQSIWNNTILTMEA